MANLCKEQLQFITGLYRDQGYTQAAIAGLVGRTQGSISKLLARARRKGLLIPHRPRPAARSEPRPSVMAASQLGPAFDPLNLDQL